VNYIDFDDDRVSPIFTGKIKNATTISESCISFCTRLDETVDPVLLKPFHAKIDSVSNFYCYWSLILQNPFRCEDKDVARNTIIYREVLVNFTIIYNTLSFGASIVAI
jgi:hypothetical protein